MPKVMLVDDDRGMREVLAEALRREGMEVAPLSGGRAALQELCRASAEGDSYDAMILDIVMPDIDGWQVLEAVKSNPLWRDLPVIVVTGCANGSGDIARVSRCDGVFVEKNGDFFSVIRAALGRLIGAAQPS